MPPKKRRTTAARPTTRQQATLSFHDRGNQVTKQAQEQESRGNESKKDPALFEDVVPSPVGVKAEAQPDLEQPTTAEKAIEQQVQEEVETLDVAPDPLAKPGDDAKREDVLGGRAKQDDATGAVGGKGGAGWVGDEEAQARKISEAQIKRYWRQKEQQRMVPRVHQEDLSLHEKILREWDMSNQYGVSLGRVLQKDDQLTLRQPCIGIARLKRWKRANLLELKPPIEVLAVLLKQLDEGDVKSQRAHVDELMSSRFIET